MMSIVIKWLLNYYMALYEYSMLRLSELSDALRCPKCRILVFHLSAPLKRSETNVARF